MERPNAWKNYTKTDLKKLEEIAKEYKAFIDAGKTERECVVYTVAALEKAGNVEGILTEQPIFTNVAAYGDHAIQYVVRVWCPTEIYWDVHKAITLNIKKVFEEDGIQMTYHHINVHLDK